MPALWSTTLVRIEDEGTCESLNSPSGFAGDSAVNSLSHVFLSEGGSMREKGVIANSETMRETKNVEIDFLPIE